MSRRILGWLAAWAVLCATLAGCGGDQADAPSAGVESPSSSQSPSASDSSEPASGLDIGIKNAVALWAPQGWQIRNRSKVTTFATNGEGTASINLICAALTTSAEDFSRSEAEKMSARGDAVKRLAPVTIDGSQAPSYRATTSSFVTTAYALKPTDVSSVDEQLRVCSLQFITSVEVDEQDRDALIASVLASWKWQ